MWNKIHRFSSPKVFYGLAQKITPWCAGIGGVLLIIGLVGGLVLAPADYQQGDAFRIIYIHVPMAFLSLMVYVFMALSAAIYSIWRIKLAHIVAKASAPLGAIFTFLALLTGSLWAKPMWGTWWVWDARLTSELLLLFLYCGYIALNHAIIDYEQAGQASGILAVVGLVNIPIIHYSVIWWNTLHQGPTLSQFAKPTIATSMAIPLFAMIGAFLCYFIVVMLLRARTEIMWRERKSRWLAEVLHSTNTSIKRSV